MTPREPFTIVILTKPTPQGRSRSTISGHHYTPKKTREATAIVQQAMRCEYRGKPLECPIILTLEFGFARPKSNKTKHHLQKPDLSNLIKLVEDAGNGIIWKDDKQIIAYGYAAKFWAEVDCIELKVEPLF